MLLTRVRPSWRLRLATYLACQVIFLFWWAAFYPGLMNADSINFVLRATTGPRVNNASVLYDSLVWVSLRTTGDLRGWQQPGQRRQDRPVGPVRLRPGDLTPEHRDLMTEHHDLRIPGSLAAAQQEQPPKTRIMIR